MSQVIDDDILLSDDEPEEIDMNYEQERLDNIANNAKLLASLGLNATPSIRPKATPSPLSAKQPKFSSAEAQTRRSVKAKEAALRRMVEPMRRSARVASSHSAADAVKIEYNDDIKPVIQITPLRNQLPKQTARIVPSGPEYDMSDAGPSSPAPRPQRGEDGVLIFEGRWKGVFTPNVTPEEMFRGGAFSGGFFCNTHSHILKSTLSSTDILSLPFTLPPKTAAQLLTNQNPDGTLNRFKVRAGQSLQEWEKAGWIWAGDPRGFAQWYTRFWEGRRCEDDERQIKRWLKVAGPTGRFKRALMKKVHGAGGVQGGGIEDEDVGRVLRQCLWQWGYELTASEYEKAINDA